MSYRGGLLSCPRFWPAAVALVLALFALLAGAGRAQAHVGVLPGAAAPGVSQTFTARVPNEKDEATIRVRIDFPAGLVVSRFQPLPGWQREVQRSQQGLISSVTWSGGRIEPGEYQDFNFVARTPAQPEKLSFKAYQTYQGGETVEWVEAENAARPAAVVDIRAGAGTAAAQPATDEHGRAASSAGATGAQAAPVAATTEGGSDLPLFVAIGGSAVAVLALAVAGIALTRRPPATPPEESGAPVARPGPAAGGMA
jgi:uncharacterized protein YcnI